MQWPENTSISFRDAILTFTNTDGGLVRVKKYQDGYTVSELDYPASGATQSVEWNNSGATVVTKPDWITVVEDDGDYDLTADANNGGERNGTVVLEDADGNQLTVYVKQAGGTIQEFRVEPLDLSFDYTGGTQFIQVIDTASDNWRIVGKPNWITVSQNQGSTTAIIQVTANANTEVNPRNGTIVIYNATKDSTHLVICNQTSEESESGRTITIVPNPATVAGTCPAHPGRPLRADGNPGPRSDRIAAFPGNGGPYRSRR